MREPFRGTTYYEGVWRQHAERLRAAGMERAPRRVVELGPGGALDLGRAALADGVEEYVALDRLPHADAASEKGLRYLAPWRGEAEAVPASWADLVLSHAVLEHVEELETLSQTAAGWLRPGGWVSHCIDLDAHGLFDGWNGHWALGTLRWHLARGRRPYFINGAPWSRHRRLLEASGLELQAVELRPPPEPGISLERCHPRWEVEEGDLEAAGVWVQARRPLPAEAKGGRAP
jgi:SAM-dependent methyltransferase